MNKFVPPLVRFLVCTLLLATSALRPAHYYEATTTEPSQKKRGTIEKKIRAWVMATAVALRSSRANKASS